MAHAPQEPIDLSPDVGLCSSCGQRRPLCRWHQCVQCHAGPEMGQAPPEQAGELCCGWYASGRFTERWVCPDCGRVHG
jgi:hypothetical protein